jgi:hypothetical protein
MTRQKRPFYILNCIAARCVTEVLCAFAAPIVLLAIPLMIVGMLAFNVGASIYDLVTGRRR